MLFQRLRKLRNLRAIILLAVVIFSSLIIVLRANATQTATQIDGMKYVTSIDTVTIGDTVFADALNNVSEWKYSISQNSIVTANGELNFTVYFPPSSSNQAYQIYRAVNVSLAQQTLALVSLTAPNYVDTDVSYGVRFFGLDSTGQSFSAWEEGSPLQHRRGTGSLENITANLSGETYLATGSLPDGNDTITKVLFYLEIPASTNAEWVSLIISSLSFALVKQTSVATSPTASILCSCQGVLISLGNGFLAEAPNQPLFQVYVSYYITGSGLSYTPYYLNGLTPEAQGFTYSKGQISYNLAVLQIQLVNGIPPFLPPPGPSSTVMFVANAGRIQSFQLDSLALRFLSGPSLTDWLTFPIDQNFVTFLSIYYLVFLFVAPTVILIALARAFEAEKNRKNSTG